MKQLLIRITWIFAVLCLIQYIYMCYLTDKASHLHLASMGTTQAQGVKTMIILHERHH